MATNNSPIFSEEEWLLLERRLALAPRQSQIVRHLFDGLNDKQIAVALDISFPTVRSHLTKIYRKLSVSDRTELMLHVFHYFRTQCHQDERQHD